MSEDAKDMAFDIMDAKDWDAFEKKGAAMTSRDEWIEQKIGKPPSKAMSRIKYFNQRDLLQEAMDFADAHPVSDDDLPTLESLRGMAPNCTGGVESVEFVRRLRENADAHPPTPEPVGAVDAPSRIYLQHDPEDTGEPFTQAAGVTWCQDRINATDIEYVRADALRDGQEVAVLREALDHAAYALFQAKRLAPEAVREHCAKAHEAACKVLDEIPTPPPREQGEERK